MIIAIKVNNSKETARALAIFYQEGWDVSKPISPRGTTYILIYIDTKEVSLANHSGIGTDLVIDYDIEDIQDIAEGNYPSKKYNECIVMSKSDYGYTYKQESSILQKGGWKNIDVAPPIDSTALYLYPQSKEYSFYTFKDTSKVYKVPFNTSLLEAISYMSKEKYGIKGEWWKCTDPGCYHRSF